MILWSAAAASAASDRMREHRNSALVGQAFFSGFTGGQRRKVNCEYACCVQFHNRNEFLEAHINAMLSVEATLM